jgi:hypothetical protein
MADVTPLSVHIREAITDNPNGEPADIAKAVLDQLPAKLMRYHMLNLLTGTVKDYFRLSGNAARSAALKPTPRGGVTKSPKYAERRNLWQEMLDGKINIDGQFKRFGSCTRDELALCIKERYVQIEGIQNQIANFEKTMALMDRYGAATPDDLPAKAAKEIV